MTTPPTLRRSIPLYLGFAATGVGVALPGAILPTLLLRFHLLDEQAGRLFLLAWIGSSLGALILSGAARRHLRTTIALGALATAIASAALAVPAPRALDAILLLYGLGLGLVMTATSILRQLQTASLPGGSGTEMVRLNLMWAIGACACPSLALHALATGRLAGLLGTLAAVFLAFALWTAFLGPSITVLPASTRSGGFPSLFRKVPIPLILMTTLITGIEASAGAWLSTYARRGGLHLGAVIEAPTCFWAGLLLSRLFWSFAPYKNATVILRGSLLLMTLATLLLVAPHAASDNRVLLLAAFLLGFGIGPTYPLLLAAVARFHHGGAIFFLAGIGSACLPWLTGIVSGHQDSLRAGFAIPCAATILMLLLGFTASLRPPFPSRIRTSQSPPL